ncbi:MAG: CoA-transferase [Amaricoccus sp.]
MPAMKADQRGDGASVPIGGFMAVGTSHRLINALMRRGAPDLTIIANDPAMPGKGPTPGSGRSHHALHPFLHWGRSKTLNSARASAAPHRRSAMAMRSGPGIRRCRPSCSAW